ncbi:MAG: hypothetical protein AAF415_06710 [Pseudomonadota bacterium]
MIRGAAMAAASLMLPAAAAAFEIPFITRPGGFTLERDPPAVVIEDGSATHRYDAGTCRSGHRREVFALYFPEVDAPIVAHRCLTVHGVRLQIFAPYESGDEPVYDVTADGLDFVIAPDRLALTAWDTNHARQSSWRPQGAEAEPAWVWRIAEAAGSALPPPADPGPTDLAALLDDPAKRRAVIGEAAAWPGWERLLRTGWALEADGLRATLPWGQAEWPEGLDADLYVYGSEPGAVLRAAPNSSAPALIPFYARILQRGPGLPGDRALTEAGWLHLCTGPDGCGFARATHVAQFGGPHAVFVRNEDVWQLETLALEERDTQ